MRSKGFRVGCAQLVLRAFSFSGGLREGWLALRNLM
jgi:hypothetical protein